MTGPARAEAPLAVVTGASGFVGSHVVDALLRRGARVRCVLRPSSSRRWLEGKPVEIAATGLDDFRGARIYHYREMTDLARAAGA